MPKITDDAKPMTGIWYRSTTDPNVLCKVTRVANGKAHVVMTGGVHGDHTFAEFAQLWEMR